VGRWWDELDPNWKTAIIFAGLTVAVIATAGLAAPLVGIAAGGIISTMVTGALVTGAVSAGIYAGMSMLTGQGISISGLAASFATGAFFGAVGSVAGMAGGSVAKLLGHAAGSPLARFTSMGIVMGASVFADLIQGERDVFAMATHAGLSWLALRGAGKSFSARGMMTFKQAQYFAPRTLGAFSKTVFNPATAGRNARAVVYGGAVQATIFGFGERFISWYEGG
jgi:hypothetical protein